MFGNKIIKRSPKPQRDLAVEAWLAENQPKQAINTGLLYDPINKKARQRLMADYQKAIKNPNDGHR